MIHSKLDKRMLPILLGSGLEAYDFCLYGLLAFYFSKIFFPSFNEYSLILSFLLFSISYFSRPIGSVLWGYIGDKYGRKKVLTSTISLMVLSATLMTFMPTYNHIGIIVCFMVMIIRFLQGIAFGGEYPTTMVMLYELAPSNRRGFFCSLTSSITCCGHLTAILFIISLLLFFGEKTFYDYAWRFLFGVSVFFILVLAYIRKNLVETLQENLRNKTPLKTTIKNYKKMLTIISFLFAPNILFFSYVYHINTLIKNYFKLDGIDVFILQACMMIYLIACLPILSYIGDRIGRQKFIQQCLFCLFFLAIPIYMMLTGYSFAVAMVGVSMLGFFVASIVGISFSMIVEHSVKNSRVSMVGISHGVAVSILGSTAPMINQFIINAWGFLAPASYLMIAALSSFLSVIVMKRSWNGSK